MKSEVDGQGSGNSLTSFIRSLTLRTQSDSPSQVCHGLSLLSRLLFRTSDTPQLLYTLLQPLIRAVFTLADKQAPSEAQALLVELEEVMQFLPADMTEDVSAALYARLGQTSTELGEWEQAANCYEKALQWQQDSEDGVLYQKLCELYYHLGKWKQAIRYGTQAVNFAENDLNSAVSTAQDWPLKQSRVFSLYSILAECEDHLSRVDNALYWVKQSLTGLLDFAHGPPHEHHNASPEEASPHSLGSSISQAPYPFFSKSESRGSMDYFWTESHESSSLRLVSPQTGSSESIGEKDRQGSEDYSPGGGHRHVSLRIRSRKPTTSSQPGKPLHDIWRRLKNGYFAHIKVEEKGEDWILSASGANSDISLEMTLGSGHPWRQVSAVELASTVELSPELEFVFETPTTAQAPAPAETMNFLFTLYKEERTFGGVKYLVAYRTSKSLTKVVITAKATHTLIRKVIVNDISLSSRTELITYVQEVLSPQLRIVEGKIKLKPSHEEWQMEVTTTKTLGTEQTAEISIKRPVDLFRNWLIEAKLDQNNVLRLEVGDREVKDITDGAEGQSAAEKLAELLMIEGGTGLALAKRQYVSGYKINIAVSDSDPPPEYQHSEAAAPPPNLGEAAVIIQKCYRKHLQRSVYLNRIQRKLQVLGRFCVRTGTEYWVVTVSRSENKAVIRCQEVGTGRVVQAEEALGKTDWRSAKDRRDTAVQLLSASRLVLTRVQQIKGCKYQISVYSRKDTVEIRASRLD